MEMCYDGALVMPSSYAVMDEEEMTYVEGGGWSGKQVLRNVTGMIAVFSLGYAGAALRSFVAAHQGLSYGRMLIEAALAVKNFLAVAPLQVKITVGLSVAATIYALGAYDLW